MWQEIAGYLAIIKGDDSAKKVRSHCPKASLLARDNHSPIGSYLVYYRIANTDLSRISDRISPYTCLQTPGIMHQSA